MYVISEAFMDLPAESPTPCLLHKNGGGGSRLLDVSLVQCLSQRCVAGTITSWVTRNMVFAYMDYYKPVEMCYWFTTHHPL